MQPKSFMGLSGFVWWTGVVEDRLDPLNLRRCRVRIFGWHTDNLQLIPTTDLPWASPLDNDNNTFKTPLEGDYLIGFFLDGESGQVPVYIGSIPGIPIETNNQSKGFSDQRTPEILADAPEPFGSTATLQPRNIGEPTTSRLARNENIEKTIIQRENAAAVKGVSIAGGGTWSQPDASYNTKPPYNRVIETESGHVFEMDDTKGVERLHLAHRQGTFIEMRPDGSKITRTIKDNFEVITGDDFVFISGTCNITVNGNANLKVGGNITAEISGNIKADVSGGAEINVGSDANMVVGGKVTAKASEFDLTGPVNIIGQTSITGDTNVTGKVAVVGSISSSGNGTFEGNINLKGNLGVNGLINVDGDVNSGGAGSFAGGLSI